MPQGPRDGLLSKSSRNKVQSDIGTEKTEYMEFLKENAFICVLFNDRWEGGECRDPAHDRVI